MDGGGLPPDRLEYQLSAPRRAARLARRELEEHGYLKAADLLSGLRARDSRLLLTERDVNRLAPSVDAWLERGVPLAAVRRTLTSGLPEDPIKHPAAFLAHRLTALLPPPLPAPPRPSTASEPPPPGPLSDLRRLRPGLPGDPTRPVP